MTRIPAGKLRLRLGARAGAEAHAQGKACGFPHTPTLRKFCGGKCKTVCPFGCEKMSPIRKPEAAGAGWNPDAGRSGGDGRDMDESEANGGEAR